jgi:L-threonylcarbamoyladenylate synthase
METYATKVWNVDNHVENSGGNSHILEAAELIRVGEAVAFPTETVYGLGANALSSEAVQKIFQAKGRPSDNPLIVHIADREQLNGLIGQMPEKAEKLMNAFWPGPLTLIFPRKEGIAPEVTAGLESVGIRMPDHPVAQQLIKAAGLPIAAPSANRSGRPSPTTAEHVLEDLNGKIAGVVDGGPTGVGVESTVLDITVDPPVILRPGGVSKERLEEVIGPVEIDRGLLTLDERPKAPGMKYTHYAPQGEMWLITAPKVEQQTSIIRRLLGQAKEQGQKVGILATEESKNLYPEADYVVACGRREEPETIARNLYDALRSFDHHQINYILSESFPTQGVGAAIMNRLAKAAGHRFYKGE